MEFTSRCQHSDHWKRMFFLTTLPQGIIFCSIHVIWLWWNDHPSSASDGLLMFPAGVTGQFKMAAITHTGNTVFEWYVKYIKHL